VARSCTLKGNKLSLEGPELKKGDKAPDATLRRSLAETTRISETHGRTRILSVVPSLDTPVCAMQTKRFNQEAAKLANVDFYTISCDLPTAQARFCGAEKIDTERFKTLSDYYDTDFGKAYGTLIPDLRIECRAVFVLDPAGVIRHVEYVPEVAEQPNYDAVLSCARQLAG
jgi:thiol peroxidase